MSEQNLDHSSHHGAPLKMLGDGALLTQDADVGLGHVVDTKTVLIVLAILVGLTFITVGASHFNFGVLNFFVAIGIAALKAAIVATYFMHLKFEGKVIWMYVAYPIILIALLISSTLADTATREKAKPMFVKELAKDYVQPIPSHDPSHSASQNGSHSPSHPDETQATTPHDSGSQEVPDEHHQ